MIEYFDDMRVELCNLKEDIDEQRNLAAQKPKQVEQMRKRLHEWRKEVDAQMPSPNPNYDPSRPEDVPKAKKKNAA